MAKSNKFGTFGGVFTPSILTILGVIMYLRLPMIIGEAGLFAAIGIIIVAHIISVTTGLSVSSIATDKKVNAGGTYYMISRSLGLPIGGTLGLALFVGLSFSVSLYLIGFAESFLGYWGFEATIDNIRIAGSIILLLVTVITFISTSLAIKTQYIIMATIGLSLLSVFLGKHDFAPEQPFLVSTGSKISLMVLFGIFFPAVTGFEAGVAMSGDLKDPKKSIPMGAISAILVGLVVYISLAFYLSYTVDHDLLANDSNVLLKISWIPELVIAGIWGATLSSALGSILGAPRILQATAADRITPGFFAKGTKKSNEPRNALLLTFIIAEAGILIGDLNMIARIVSIFFITTYGFLNLSCAFERLTSADFRPAFKTPAWVSLLGASACLIVMIQLDFVALLGGSLVLGLVYFIIKRKELALQSGDTWGSIWSSLVKTGLRKLKTNALQNRNWRPNIIMFSGEDAQRHYMVKLGNDIAGKLGMITGFQLIESDCEILPRKEVIKDNAKDGSGFFKNVHTCRSIYEGIDEIVRVYGFNGVEPNTILMGWSNNQKNRTEFIHLISRLKKNNFNAAYLQYNNKRGMGSYKTLDIWWSGWGGNLTFAINLIRHLTSSRNWSYPKVRLFVVTNDSAKTGVIYTSLQNILDQYRVKMEVIVIDNSVENMTRNQIICKNSGETDLTIVGIPDKKIIDTEKTYVEISELSEKMGSMLLINASSNFEEYNIISKVQSTVTKSVFAKDSLVLPELILTNDPSINEHIQALDIRGMERAILFYDKTLLPLYEEQEAIIQELKLLMSSDFKNFGTEKTRYILYTTVKKTIDNYISEGIDIQRSILKYGVEMYCTQLRQEILSLPKKLTINNGNKKSEKKFYNQLFKRDETVPLRNLAVKYLENHSQEQLSDLLADIRRLEIQFLLSIKDLFTSIDCDDVKRVKIKKDGLISKLSLIGDMVLDSNQDFRKRLLEEVRSNLLLMTEEIKKPEANKLFKRKKVSLASTLELSEKNMTFPAGFADTLVFTAKKLSLDLIVLTMKNKTRNLILDMSTAAANLTELELTSKIERFIDDLTYLSGTTNDNSQFPEFTINETFFSTEEFMETFSRRISAEIEELPEEIEISSEAEIIKVPVRKMLRYFIDDHLLGVLYEDLEKMEKEIRKLIIRVKDHIGYMHFKAKNQVSPDMKTREYTKEIVEESLSELKEDKIEADTLSSSLQQRAIQNFINTFEPLSSHKISESCSNLPQILRKHQGKRTIGHFQKLLKKFNKSFTNLIVRILYSQSEGILLARELSKQNAGISDPELFLDLVEKVSPNPLVYDSMPAYYKNLFSGRSSISDEDFWIERMVEENQFSKALTHYRSGYNGGILITGERNSGKTSFCQHVSRKFFQDTTVYHIFPPLEGSCLLADFENELRKNFGVKGSLNTIFDHLPEGSVVVLHDLELWWESSEMGMKVIETILLLIRKYSNKCLIICNMNIGSYLHINQIRNLSDSFISVISCRPFSSEDLKDLIMRRHRSRGIKFTTKGKNEENMSDVAMAGMFNKFFYYSKGNPGTALYSWLCHIKSFSTDHIEIGIPVKPNYSLFSSMPDDWKVLLYQISLHKRMTIKKFANVLMLDQSKFSNILDALIRAGLVKEKSAGIFVINPYVDNFLTEYLTP